MRIVDRLPLIRRGGESVEGVPIFEKGFHSTANIDGKMEARRCNLWISHALR